MRAPGLYTSLTSLLYDATASPPTVLSWVNNSLLTAVYLNGSVHSSSGLPSSVLAGFYRPLSMAVDSAGYVFLWNGHYALLCFSPYPAYAYIGNLHSPLPDFAPVIDNNPGVTTSAAVINSQGEFIYTASTVSISVYQLSFNASAVPTNASLVATLALADPILSVQVHPVTGQLCAYQGTVGVLSLYTPNYTNPSSPVYTLSRVYNTSNSALSVLLSYPVPSSLVLVRVTSAGMFVFGGHSNTGVDAGGVMVFFLMTADGLSSPYPITPAATLLNTGSFEGEEYSVSMPPIMASSPDGSVFVVPTPGYVYSPSNAVPSGFEVLQGYPGADPSFGSIPLTVFTDFNSSYSVAGALPSSVTAFTSTYNYTSTSYATDRPGSMHFGVQLVWTQGDNAYVAVAVSGANVTLVSLTGGCPSANSGVYLSNTFSTLSVTYHQCNYSVSWQQPTAGALVINLVEQRSTFTFDFGANHYFITIPLTSSSNPSAGLISSSTGVTLPTSTATGSACFLFYSLPGFIGLPLVGRHLAILHLRHCPCHHRSRPRSVPPQCLRQSSLH